MRPSDADATLRDLGIDPCDVHDAAGLYFLDYEERAVGADLESFAWGFTYAAALYAPEDGREDWGGPDESEAPRAGAGARP